MNKPTPTNLREDPRIPWASLFNIPEGGGGDAVLQEEIDLGWGYLSKETGRNFATDITTSDDVVVAGRALKLRIVQQAAYGKGTFGEIMAAASGVQSYAVPGYSENRFDPSQGRQMGTRPWLFNPWPELDRLIYILATPDRQAQVRAEAKGTWAPDVQVGHETETYPNFGIEFFLR